MIAKWIVFPMIYGTSLFAQPGATPAPLRDIHRIVFLGDSITQAGGYVTDFECWLISQGIRIEILNLGLASETVTDLTGQENSGHLKRHGFGHPFLSERLARVLEATRPDLIFACYGMNDGDSLPSDDAGMNRFTEAVRHLREAALKAGVKRVVLCTPPIRDSPKDQNLTRYSAWLLTQRSNGWDVVDIHEPMRKAQEERRKQDPSFKFSGDGVHPGREGHWLMAREILTQFLGVKLDGVPSSEELLGSNGKEIRKLINDRMLTLFKAWMNMTGHKRPGVPGNAGPVPGFSMDAANAKANELSKQISAKMTQP
jgi:lysophospholipase L1-like esterase